MSRSGSGTQAGFSSASVITTSPSTSSSRSSSPTAVGATGVVRPFEIGVRRPDGSEVGARRFTPAPWPLAAMPSTCASARRRPCAALLSHRALPPDDRLGRLLPAAPADGPGVPLDRVDCALYGDKLTLERVLLVPQRVQDSALRYRDLLSARRPAHIICARRRHARHPGTTPDAAETDRDLPTRS